MVLSGKGGIGTQRHNTPHLHGTRPNRVTGRVPWQLPSNGKREQHANWARGRFEGDRSRPLAKCQWAFFVAHFGAGPRVRAHEHANQERGAIDPAAGQPPALAHGGSIG